MENKSYGLSYVKHIALYISLSFLLLVFPGFLRSISPKLDFAVSHFAYFGVVYWLIKRYPSLSKTIVITFTSTVIITYVLLCSIAGRLLTESAPNFISIASGCINSYVFYHISTNRSRIIFLLFTASICVWYIVWGSDIWRSLYLIS
jgi:hypothetical protein